MRDSIVGSKVVPTPPLLRRALLWTLQIAVVGVICWLLFRTVNSERLIAALRGIDLAILLIATLPMVIERLLRPCRLAILLGAPARLYQVISAQNVSQLINLVLPFRSGEMLLVLMLRGLNIAAGSRAISIVLLDRLFDVVFVLVIFIGAIIALRSFPATLVIGAVLLGVICLVTIAGIAALLHAKTKVVAFLNWFLTRTLGQTGTQWTVRIEGVIDGFAVILEPRPLIFASIITIVSWCLATVGVWLVLLAIWPIAPLAAAVLTVCLTVIGVTLISVPAGIGVFHAAFAIAAMSFGAPQEVGIAFGVVGHFLMISINTLMGLIGMRVVKRAGISSVLPWGLTAARQA